jgi:hypothetical protein
MYLFTYNILINLQFTYLLTIYSLTYNLLIFLFKKLLPSTQAVFDLTTHNFASGDGNTTPRRIRGHQKLLINLP